MSSVPGVRAEVSDVGPTQRKGGFWKLRKFGLDSLSHLSEEATTLPAQEPRLLPGFTQPLQTSIGQRAAWPGEPFQSKSQGLPGSIPVRPLSTLSKSEPVAMTRDAARA